MALPSQLSGCLCRSESAGEFYTEWEESYESFDQMNLHENLLRGIYAYGEDSGRAALLTPWLLSATSPNAVEHL